MSLEKVLQSLGLDEAEITSLQSNPEDLTPFQTKIQESVKAKLLEDETFYTGLDKNKLPQDWFKGKFDEGVNKIASLSKQGIDKHFGLTADEKKTFSEEDLKDVTKYIAKATEIYKSKFTGDKDIAKLQDENISLKARLEEMDTQVATLKEKFDSDLTEKLTQKELETLSLMEAGSLQENVPVKIGIIWDKVFAGVKNKYAVIIDNGVPSVRKKDNTSFKVENPEQKGKYLELKDVIALELKGMGAWKDSAPAPGSQKTTVQVQPNKGLTDSEAMKKKIAEEEAFFNM